MGVGARGRANLAEAQERLTRREGTGNEQKRKKRKRPQSRSVSRYGCSTQAGACQEGDVRPAAASKRRGSRRPGKELHSREGRSHRGGHTVRGAAARQASQGRGTSGGTPDGAAGRKRRGGLRPGQGWPCAGPPGVSRAPNGLSVAHDLTFKEVVVLVVAGAHGAAEKLRGGSGGGNGGGTRGRRCRGNPSERGASAAGPSDEPRPVCVTSGRPQPLAESTSGEMAPRP